MTYLRKTKLAKGGTLKEEGEKKKKKKRKKKTK